VKPRHLFGTEQRIVLGNRGRFSTDLDFTARTEISDPDGEILALAEVFEKPFHEIQFRLDLGNEKEWRSAERTTWSVYPTYAHGLGNGSIKFEVSLREAPILEPALLPQLPQAYFTHLEFKPAALPCLHECELITTCLTRQLLPHMNSHISCFLIDSCRT
jgi:hypothetical protein